MGRSERQCIRNDIIVFCAFSEYRATPGAGARTLTFSTAERGPPLRTITAWDFCGFKRLPSSFQGGVFPHTCWEVTLTQQLWLPRIWIRWAHLTLFPFLLDWSSTEPNNVYSRAIASAHLYGSNPENPGDSLPWEELAQGPSPGKWNVFFIIKVKRKRKPNRDEKYSWETEANENPRLSHENNQTNKCLLDASFITALYRKERA